MRYRREFRERVAMEVMRGDLTYREASSHYGVSQMSIARWIKDLRRKEEVLRSHRGVNLHELKKRVYELSSLMEKMSSLLSSVFVLLDDLEEKEVYGGCGDNKGCGVKAVGVKRDVGAEKKREKCVRIDDFV